MRKIKSQMHKNATLFITNLCIVLKYIKHVFVNASCDFVLNIPVIIPSSIILFLLFVMTIKITKKCNSKSKGNEKKNYNKKTLRNSSSMLFLQFEVKCFVA